MNKCNKEKLGAFIVPTGIGASIGGFAGDASNYARKFSEISKLIVNPNVVNAGCFSGINQNMFYVEGYSIDEFFKGKISLIPSTNNKIGVIFDKAISQEVLNIHINTINAVKTVYGVMVSEYEITDNKVCVDFYVNQSGNSMGNIKNIEEILKSAKRLIQKGCEAIAIVCKFEDCNNEEYENGLGVDPIGGVEAIISHYISKKLKVPCAHSPAFDDYTISTKIVNPKASAEYITPTYLPCVLLGLNNAPKISCFSKKTFLNINNLDYLVMPYNSIGSIPVLESLKRGVKIFAIKENVTLLNVTNDNLNTKCGIYLLDTYDECLEFIKNNAI